MTKLTNDPVKASDLIALSKKKRGKKIDVSGYKVVSVRMRTAEYIALAQQAEISGITNNRALRIAARRIAGFLEIDEEVRKTLREITDNIGAIATDINKLNQHIDRSDPIDMDAFKKQRSAFGSEFARLDNKLQTILNVSRRRQDGLVMLNEARSP